MKIEEESARFPHPLSIEDAEEQVLNAIKRQHPEWAGPDGDCSWCVAYEFVLAEPLSNPENPSK